MSGAIEEPQWPPRSPYEAVISSPSGRKKLQQRTGRLSPSPSPLKRPRVLANTRALVSPNVEMVEEDEDEETLQLQLQALEAKLKLKRLQNKKARNAQIGSDAENEGAVGVASVSRATSALSSRNGGQNKSAGSQRSKSAADIQIPLSPERKPTVAQEQRSPGRVLLGIDKGRSARNVSLRRAPSLRQRPPSLDEAFESNIEPSRTRNESRNGRLMSLNQPRPVLKSFNERMAENRDRDRVERARQGRTVRLQAQKSSGFNVRQEDLDAFEDAAGKAAANLQRTASIRKGKGFSRDQVVDACQNPAGGLLQRSNTVSSMNNERRADKSSSRDNTVEHLSRPQSTVSLKSASRENASRLSSVSLSDESRPATPGDPGLFEGFSQTNLSRRILPHSFLTRTLDDKNAVTIPTLLKHVKAPDFSLPPDLDEKDVVVFGIIASKSAPLAHKGNGKPNSQGRNTSTSTEEATKSEANVNGNFMVFTLTDLKWTLDLYIFTTAFTRWRRLQPGTLIAILNPEIMPPPPGRTDTNRWSLTLHSSDDTILEIGTSKDLSWCKAVKKDGNSCSAWIDNRKTEYCEFHVDRNVERMRRGRMEVQGMSAPFAPGGKSAGRHGFFGSTKRRRQGADERDNGLLKEGKQYDRSSHSAYFITPRLQDRSAASLLDADEDGGIHENRDERMRKALATKEKEREIARRLGDAGNGAGAEYLRLGQTDSAVSTKRKYGQMQIDSSAPDSRDAEALGLKNNRATNVMLSPLKRNNSSARRVCSGKSFIGDTAPKRKKTRFEIEGRVREPGRDSLGGDGLNIIGHADDELDIV